MIMNTVLKVYVPAQAFLIHQAKLFAKRTEGASGIEYALIAGMVAVALVAFVPTISTAVGAIFTKIQTAVTSSAA
ncbi:pilus assembly protein Flp/PilA [Pseudomonas taetrolens]|uniref:Pilus assembly protein Flp/PilA n=1 Tax=Pseudomonas taetrolens TaxID=47884 RepID=A0A0J6JI49_PSETA|nr:Flp family type IVb pilin [Pseudomonas taetrolens]KMM83432.1 hypothetical protein TU78_16660 [Pseudomonas taetrolens]SED54291.1 pilus assembly protein Flp/PilA [Pseudomonas taetrolens]SQF88146.1 Flp/Fap pilin component [Pseudomonas taetrolens]VEH51336.1 Flp/Fap pilin component [Pseudomonas taetrolens]